MARAKNGGRMPAKINPLNDDLARAGDGHVLAHAAFAGPGAGTSAVPLTAGQLTYTQNFDSLASSGATGTSLPADWTFNETGGAAPATYSVGTGSGTTGDTWSFGIAGTNPVADRAFGSLASTTVTQILVGASFANMSGATITAILISYVGEQWRRGGNTIADRLDFQISFNATSLTTGSWTDVNGLDFVSINASASPLTLDGNAAANRLAISFNIAGVSVVSGATFWIRWIDTNIAGNDDGLAIDNFSLTATVNRPPIVAAAIPDHHSNEDAAVLYTIPANSFSDPDGNTLTYTASRGDNSPLPSWLTFTAATRTFSGTPPANFNGTLSVKVIASDGSFSVSDIFDLIIDPVNDAAIIGGTDRGAVTEDGSLTASGQLTISDVDASESSFQPVAAGTAGGNGYGTFELLADGRWTYTLDNSDPDVQALHAVDTLADTLIVRAVDGTTHFLSVTIHGANEASATPYARANGEALVNSSVAGLQSQPSVAFLADGRYVIVFQIFDGDQLDVRGRIFNRDGSPAAPDFSVNIAAAGEQHLPQIAALADGGFVVVWQDSAGGSYDIIGRIYEADGSSGGEIPIATTLANETAPVVAGLPGGGFVALWIDDSDPDGDVRAQIFLANGSPAGLSFAVNAPAAGGQVHAAVTVLAGGTIVAVWEDGAAGDVRMRLFSAAGSPLTAELTANGSPAGSQGAPCVVALAGGGYAIAWMDGGADGDGYGIYARLFEGDGDPAGAGFRVNTLAAGDQMFPSIAALPDGGFVVSWADGAGPDADDIRAQRFDAHGVPVDAERVVNGHADGVQFQSAMAANMYGTLVVAWNDASSPGVGGDDDGAVVHALLTPGGTPPAGPTAAIIGGEDTGAVAEDIAPGTSGTLIVTDPDAGEARLVAQTDAAGSSGYGLFQVNADGAWTYSIAGSALADMIPGGETRTDSIIVSSIDGTAHVIAVTIHGTNDAPTATIAPAGTLAAIEQTALDLKGFMSVADLDAGAGPVTATLSVGHGVLHLAAGGSGASVSGNDSASVTITGTIIQINALLGGDATSIVTYTATGDAPPAATTLTLSIDDNAAAGALTGSDSATIAIIAVNDAPAATATPGTTAYVESVDMAPGSIAVDNALTLADADDDFLIGATVSISNNFQPGQDILAFTNNDATTFGNITAVYDAGTGVLTLASAGGTATLAQWQAALRAVTYSNSSEEPSQATRTIGFTVDDGDGAGAAATRLLSVAAQNDSPSGANGNVTIDEDAAFIFTAAHFGFTDLDGDAFASVRFGAAPAGGTLYFDAVAVTGFPTTLYSAADIAAGKLVFVPTANLNGAGAASVGFTVVDDGGTAGAGQDADTIPNALSFDIVSVNDEPSGADKVIGIDEDAACTLTLADFGFSDLDGDAFEAVIFSHPVSGGTLYINGNPMNSATLVYLATIDAGGLVFVPAADATGTLGGITFRVRDDGGFDNGGQAADTSPNVLSFVVTALNDAPVNIVPGAQAVDEDGSLVLGAANGNALSVADVDATILTVTLAVARGTLTLASTAGLAFSDSAGDATMTFTGTAAAINAALGAGVTYTPAADDNGGDTLCVTTSDDGALTDADTVAITINPVNDAPAGASTAFTVNEDSAFTFNAGHFGFTDAADGSDFLGVVITTLPLAGTILLDAVALVAGIFVAAADIALGRLTFVPAPDAYGVPYGSFTFQVRDDGGTGNGGQDTDQSPDMIIFNVAALNDAPIITAPGPQTIDEAGTLILTGGSLISVADIDATTLTVTLGVVHGTLTLNAILGLSFSDGDGTADATMTFSGTAAAINAALDALAYVADPDHEGADAISIQVTDGGQTGSGPVGTASDTISININSVNDAPSGTDKTVTGSEDHPYVFTALDFGFSDPVEGNGFFAVQISTLPLNGDILLNGVAVVAGDFIAVSAINAGMLTFQPDPDMFASPYASFQFRVQDDGGILNGGVDTDPVANTITINVTPDNDPPVAVDDTLAATEDVPVTYTAAQIVGNDTDVDGDPRTIASVSNSTGGTAMLNGDGSVTFTPAPNFNGVAGFDYVVSDGNGGTDTGHVTVNVAAVDDAPVAQPDAFVITESQVIVAGNLFGNDSDPDGPPLAISAVGGGPGANVGTQFTLDSGALLTVRADGTFDYNPNGVFLRTPTAGSGASNTPSHDSFTYTLAGGNTVTVSITLTGLDTDDLLLGTAGADVLMAGNGSDELIGGLGDDLLYGGSGDDFHSLDSRFDIVIELAGEGYDNVLASVSYVLAEGVYAEVLSTTDHNGTALINLTGNSLANVLIGNQVQNLLDGGAGGADILQGLGGDDFYFVDADDRVYEAAGGGYDNVLARTDHILAAGTEVEVLSTSDHGGTAAISLGGNAFGQVLVGNAGNNYLDGGGGADILQGLGGNDTYIVDADDRVYESSGGGHDNVAAKVGYALQAGQEIEVLSTTDHGGIAAINLTGNEHAQVVIGNAGANVLNGGFGDDLLQGLSGADTFAFTTALGGGNVDTILDFVSGTDKIALDDAVFTGLTPGALPAGAFVTGTAALDADDRIIYDSTTGALYFDADGNGAGAMVRFATLSGLPVLIASDFTVI